MHRNVQHDLSDSAFEFQRLVWPAIQSFCGGGDIVPVEAIEAEGFAKQLDVMSGIDVWQIHRDRGMRGIASRVQWDDGRPQFPYRTFTVRKRRFNGSDTEYAKRVRSLNVRGGWLYPHLTCQAYIGLPRRSGALLAAAVVKTQDLIEMIGDGRCHVKPTSNADFWVVDWNDFLSSARFRRSIKIWRNSELAVQAAPRATAPHESEIHW